MKPRSDAPRLVPERLVNILRENLGRDEEEMTPGTKLCLDLGADSLDYVEIIMSIEEEFGVSIDDEELPGDDDCSIQQLIDLITAKGAAL